MRDFVSHLDFLRAVRSTRSAPLQPRITFDLDAMAIQVEHRWDQGALVPVKTRASRVDLSSTAARAARPTTRRKPNDLGLVVPSPRGELLNHDDFRHRVFRLRPELTGFRFHELRHTYAALMVAAGARPKYLQVHIRHSAIRVTLACCSRRQVLSGGRRTATRA